MSEINLTPEELREWARLEILGPSHTGALYLRWSELYRTVPSRRQLALALADAIEERDRLRARVEELESAHGPR